MDRINKQILDANIELVDRNKILEKDFKELQKKVRLAIDYIDRTRKLNILNDISSIQLAPIENILKGSDNIESINS